MNGLEKSTLEIDITFYGNQISMKKCFSSDAESGSTTREQKFSP